jgi:zinc transporter ZupT
MDSSAGGNGSAGTRRDPGVSDGNAAGSAQRRPVGIAILSGILAAEATALLVAAASFVIQLVSGAPTGSFWSAVFLLVLLLAFSAWLYAMAYFLFRAFRWPRAGAFLAQLFVLTLGFPALAGGLTLIGLLMLIPAATAIVLLFDKRVVSFASRSGGGPPAV